MRNKARIITVAAALTLAVVTAGCSNGDAQGQSTSSPAPTIVPTKEDIAKQFDNWNAALATGDPSKVADLYAPDAVLLPTVSNKVRTNRAEIVDYFEHFLQNKPSGQIEHEVINVLDPDTAINTGAYRFTMSSQQQVQARYTFVYEYRGKWLIINHHSSAMPEK